VTLELRAERFIVGLRGLALLRGWPFGDPVDAEAHLEAIRQLLSAGDRPAMSIEIDDLDVDAAYASWAETYDGPNPLIEAEEPAVRGFLDGLDAGRALDVACGTGRLAGILTDLGHHVVGADPSAEMLSRARAAVPEASFVRADVRHLPIDDGTIDVAVCGLALTHVPSLVGPVAELARTLRPGGHLILSDVHPVAVATGAHAFFRRPDGARAVTRNHVHWPSAYVDAFRAAGLSIEAASEPLFNESFVSEMPEAAVRDSVREALVELPFALVWSARKPG
jgi:SAM-dependent methyltransferase